MGALQTPEEVAKAMDRIEKEAIRMGALVEDLLELARLDETRPLNLVRIDLVPHGVAPAALPALLDRFAALAQVRCAGLMLVPPFSDDPEKTILRTNLEAAREIARQIRLRDIGGIIVCDFIDMETRSNRDKVLQELRTHLGRDRARTVP